MTAFVLGAGLGTRLRPLTERRPKPLIPVCNRPLITYAFDHLRTIGVDRFIVNTHWLPEVYDHDFPDGHYQGCPITLRNEPDVLETAGGIKNVEDLLGAETFVVYNGDILSDLPLAPALAEHRAARNEVTLVLRSKDGPLQISIDPATNAVTDIGGRLHGGNDSRFLFTGIYFVEPAFLHRIPAATKISVIPIFLDMIQTGATLGSVVEDAGFWWDLGSRDKYLDVHRSFAAGGSPWIHPTAQIGRNARITGATAIGRNARIGDEATLHDSIIWDGAEIAPHSTLQACIVTGRDRVEGAHRNSDL